MNKNVNIVGKFLYIPRQSAFITKLRKPLVKMVGIMIGSK